MRIRALVRRLLYASVGEALAPLDNCRLRAFASALRSSAAPVVIGPWLGEVGFEVLYWIPFLQWLYRRFDLTSLPTTVISRGGTAAWYSNIAPVAYRDVFEALNSHEFRDMNERRVRRTGALKQHSLTEEEWLLVKRLIPGARRSRVIHPSLMVARFAPFWGGYAPVSHVLRRTVFLPIASPQTALPENLKPGEYVAAKFYFSQAFPDTPTSRSYIRDVLQHCAQRRPVALLNTGIAVDDHTDADTGHNTAARFVTIADRMTTTNNLAIQTQVVAHARFFVGTYGGFSYLAPFLGVPSYSSYSVPSFNPAHNDTMLRAQLALGNADVNTGRQDFVCLDVAGCRRLLVPN